MPKVIRLLSKSAPLSSDLPGGARLFASQACQAEDTPCGILGSCGLKANDDRFLALGQLRGNRIFDLEEAVRGISVKLLLGDFLSVHKNVESSPAGIASPVDDEKSVRRPRINLQAIAKPAAIESMPPFTGGNRSG